MDLSSAQLQLPSNFPHQELNAAMIAGELKSPAAGDKGQQADQKKPRPPEDGPQACPRCESTNTKFCYYNNYSLTQPRYFCKACRRYWTKGGTLRNVPVGGGCRKSSKRSSSASTSPSHFLKRAHTLESPMTSAPAQTPVFAGIGGLHYGYGSGFGFDGLIGNGDFTDGDTGVNLLGYPGVNFLQDVKVGGSYLYGGNNGPMYQGGVCNYDENGAGNSNCVSGVSDDLAAVAVTCDDGVAVKQERAQTDAFWWPMEPVKENWNGLIENPAWNLLNAPALL